jgi:hypothetical protein
MSVLCCISKKRGWLCVCVYIYGSALYVYGNTQGYIFPRDCTYMYTPLSNHISLSRVVVFSSFFSLCHDIQLLYDYYHFMVGFWNDPNWVPFQSREIMPKLNNFICHTNGNSLTSTTRQHPHKKIYSIRNYGKRLSWIRHGNIILVSLLHFHH